MSHQEIRIPIPILALSPSITNLHRTAHEIVIQLGLFSQEIVDWL